MKDIDFIKGFSNISVTQICKDNNIDMSNLYNRCDTPKQRKNARLIRKEIEKKITNLYEEGFDKIG